MTGVQTCALPISIDDLDDLMGNTSGKKRGHAEADDTFQVDFIDLD